MENNNNSNSIMSKEKIDQMAVWVGFTLSSAFFSSLERFSCVHASTFDPDPDYHHLHPLPLPSNTTTAVNANPTTAHHSNDVVNLPLNSQLAVRILSLSGEIISKESVGRVAGVMFQVALKSVVNLVKVKATVTQVSFCGQRGS